MTSISSIEKSLADVESALAQVGEALQTGEAQQLQHASEQLRTAAVAFSRLLSGVDAAQLSTSLVVRAKTVAVRLTTQRDALARLSAMVDRQVATIVPQKRVASTYGPSTSRGNGRTGPYGS